MTHKVETGAFDDSLVDLLREKGIFFEKTGNAWRERNLRCFDSRTKQWKDILDILSHTAIGKEPVIAVLRSAAVPSHPNSVEVIGNFRMEICEYIATLPLKRIISNVTRRFRMPLGCFEEAAPAVRAIVEVLKKPPSNECALASKLDVGQCTACLVLYFRNAEINVNVFRE